MGYGATAKRRKAPRLTKILAEQYVHEGLSPAAAERQAEDVDDRARGLRKYKGPRRPARAERRRALAARLGRYRDEHGPELTEKRIAGKRTSLARRRQSFSYWLSHLLARLTDLGHHRGYRLFAVCPLCDKVVFDAEWHRCCSDGTHQPAMRRAARRWPPGRPRRRAAMLTRDVILLVAVRIRARLSQLPLSPAARRRWEKELTNRRLLKRIPRALRPGSLGKVSRLAAAVVPRLPGSWSIVFSRKNLARDPRSPGDRYERVLENWQLAVPLPQLVRALDHSKTIVRLYRLSTLTEESIATLTGAPRDQVSRVIAAVPPHPLPLRTRTCEDCGEVVAGRCTRYCPNCRAKHRGRGNHKYDWTAAQDAMLREQYDPHVKGRTAAIAAQLGRPPWIIIRRARSTLGLKRRNYDWTPAQDARLRARYSESATAGAPWAWAVTLSADLGRPPMAVYRRAVALGLTSSGGERSDDLP